MTKIITVPCWQCSLTFLSLSRLKHIWLWIPDFPCPPLQGNPNIVKVGTDLTIKIIQNKE